MGHVTACTAACSLFLHVCVNTYYMIFMVVDCCRREVHNRRDEVCLPPAAAASARDQLQALHRRLRKRARDHQRDVIGDGRDDHFAARSSARRHAKELDGSDAEQQAVTGDEYLISGHSGFWERADIEICYPSNLFDLFPKNGLIR